MKLLCFFFPNMPVIRYTFWLLLHETVILAALGTAVILEQPEAVVIFVFKQELTGQQYQKFCM